MSCERNLTSRFAAVMVPLGAGGGGDEGKDGGVCPLATFAYKGC